MSTTTIMSGRESLFDQVANNSVIARGRKLNRIMFCDDLSSVNRATEAAPLMAAISVMKTPNERLKKIIKPKTK